MPATNELLQEGRYRISQPHDGSEGVFEAFDTVRNTTVTVREIPVKLNKVTTPSQQESLRLAFSAQAKALTEIEHDALLHIEDFFSEIDRQYIVMESVEGSSLHKLLMENKRSFSIEAVTAWADNLLDALNYLHSRKPPIFHLNIRPENLKLDLSGKVKLAGVALESGEAYDSQPGEDELRYSPMELIWPGLDAASQKVITNSYDDRSVRILREPPDARSDIYSLGATLYFLITGVEPVDPLERSIEVLEGKLDPLREPTKVNSQIPPEISDVLMKALEIRRENRYDSALIMRHVLQAAIAKLKDREVDETREQQSAVGVVSRATDAQSVPAPAQSAEVVKHSSFEAVAADEYTAAEFSASVTEEEANAGELLAGAVGTPDDNLLEIPVAAEVFAYRDTNEVDEDELAAVLEELEVADAAAARQALPTSTVTPEPVQSRREVETTVQAFEEPLDSAQNGEPAQPLDFEVDKIFSEPARSGFPLPMPALVGAGVLGIVLAVGAWFVMSGSSEAPAPPAAQTVQSVQPVESEPTPAAEPVASGQNAEQVSSGTPETEQQGADVKAAPTPKPKKVEPAKPTAGKKKVTVDDLINDN